MWCFLFLCLFFFTRKAKTVAQDAWEFFGSQFALEMNSLLKWLGGFLKISWTWMIEKQLEMVDFLCVKFISDNHFISESNVWNLFLSLKFAEEKASFDGTIEWELSVLPQSYFFSQKARLLRDMGPSDEKATWDRDEVCCTCFISTRKRRMHIAWFFGFKEESKWINE